MWSACQWNYWNRCSANSNTAHRLYNTLRRALDVANGLAISLCGTIPLGGLYTILVRLRHGPRTIAACRLLHPSSLTRVS